MNSYVGTTCHSERNERRPRRKKERDRSHARYLENKKQKQIKSGRARERANERAIEREGGRGRDLKPLERIEHCSNNTENKLSLE